MFIDYFQNFEPDPLDEGRPALYTPHTPIRLPAAVSRELGRFKTDLEHALQRGFGHQVVIYDGEDSGPKGISGISAPFAVGEGLTTYLQLFGNFLYEEVVRDDYPFAALLREPGTRRWLRFTYRVPGNGMPDRPMGNRALMFFKLPDTDSGTPIVEFHGVELGGQLYACWLITVAATNGIPTSTPRAICNAMAATVEGQRYLIGEGYTSHPLSPPWERNPEDRGSREWNRAPIPSPHPYHHPNPDPNPLPWPPFPQPPLPVSISSAPEQFSGGLGSMYGVFMTGPNGLWTWVPVASWTNDIITLEGIDTSEYTIGQSVNFLVVAGGVASFISTPAVKRPDT
jgi:hypothetical protein